MRVNLGCPRRCAGWTCVDIQPKDQGVIKADALTFLRISHNLDHVRAYNLLEHLPAPLEFLLCAREALKPGGLLELITDNAEWVPFYLPIPIPKIGVGAHGARSELYLKWSGYNNSPHMAIFSKAHLSKLLRMAGFRHFTVRRMWEYAFARLHAVAYK